jgi:hypothetical protein
MRAIRRDTVADIAEIRDVELACIDALFESPGHRYGRPSAHRAVGLDHADGIEDRQLVIDQKIGESLAEGIPAILEGLNLTAKRKAAAPKVIEATMLRLAAG